MKHHITTYTRTILLMAVILLIPSQLWAYKEAYVQYADDTLTFRYDENRASYDNTYSLPAAGVSPEWLSRQGFIKKVVFSEDFKDAHPERCAKWFYGMKNLTEIQGMEYLCTDSANDMSQMFYGCQALTTIDLSHFCTESVTTMTYMFFECKSLTELDVTSFNTEQVEDMSYMFSDCAKLTELDLSSFNTPKVTNMDGMFIRDYALTQISVSDLFAIDQVTSSKDMFFGCIKLPSYDRNCFDKTKAPDYLTYLAAQPWAEYQDATKTLTFRYDNTRRSAIATGKYELPVAAAKPGWWANKRDVTKVVFSEAFKDARPKNCAKWFYLMDNLTEIQNIEYLCTDSVTDMSDMFNYCSKLTELDLSYFSTQMVTDMSSMFCNAGNLTNIYVSDIFVLDQVTHSEQMFFNCIHLPSYKSNEPADKTKAPIYLTYLKPWVEYQADTKTLTFHNDHMQNTVKATAKYELPAAGKDPGWLERKGDVTKVVFCENFKSARPERCTKWFYQMTALTDITGLEYLNTSEANDMSRMFGECSSLTSLDLRSFHTDSVTTMTHMFDGCSSLTEVDLSSFHTEKVDDMSSMFGKCSSLTALDVSSLNTANVRNMASMFSECSSLTAIDLSTFNTSEVQDMNLMFYKCSSLTELDLSSFHTEKVKDMYGMFWRCYGLTALDLSAFNTAEVQDMRYMFNACTHLTTLGLSSFNTENVTSMYAMFSYCYKLPKLDVSSFNTGKVTDMGYMFTGCYKLTELDLSSFNTEKVTSMYAMFSYCYELPKLDLSSLCTANVQDMAYMFYQCYQLSELDLSSFSTANVKDMAYMFYECYQLTELDLSSFCTDSVSRMTEMFSSCTHLKKLDLSSFSTEKVDNMNGMFWECNSLTALDLSSFNTANVKDMSFMFSGCSSLTSIDLSSFNTEKVDTMYGMFYYCNSLTELDLSSFNTANVKDMRHMFDMGSNGSRLKKIYVSPQFVTSNKDDWYVYMFNGCTAIPNFDAQYVGKEKAHYNETEGGYLTLRRHFSVGEARYNVDGYLIPMCYTDVDFTDGEAYSAPCAFTFSPGNTASYTRTTSSHWATLCLPFAFDPDNSTARFYRVESYTDGTIAVRSLYGTVVAGTPVLAYISGGELSVSATGAAVVTEAKQLSCLKGVFTQTEVADEDYIIANDHFWNAGWLKSSEGSSAQHVYVAPYRAYLTLNFAAGAKPNSISINLGETDGIDCIDTSDLATFLDGAELYDLQGRRLSAPQRGVMIVRKGGVSRKVVIKGSQVPQGL